MSYPETYTMPAVEIEAECRDCGQKIADGCMTYRSLDAYDDDPEPYCPNCEGDNLKFLPSREDFHRDRDC